MTLPSEKISYLKYIRLKIHHNPFRKVILDALWKLGVRISPFYLVLESDIPEDREFWKFDQDQNKYRIRFLDHEDMKTLGSIPFRNISETTLQDRLDNGMLCLGVIYQGKLAAFGWCDLENCHFEGCPFPLKKDEAYLFDAYTMMDFRGKGLAPYMRLRFYDELTRKGIKKFYSISERFNEPSIRFKKKLNARFIGSGLYIELFNKWKFKWGHVRNKHHKQH